MTVGCSSYIKSNSSSIDTTVLRRLSIQVSDNIPFVVEMDPRIIFIAVICCNAAIYTRADNEVGTYAVEGQLVSGSESVLGSAGTGNIEDDAVNSPHDRTKRTLFLKKKILGAGLLGFGLGAIKGYKAGYRHAPEVHHVYVAPSPVKYVEYVEKPVYIEKIIDRPVFRAAPEYEPPRWTPSDVSSSYGSTSNDGYW